jgi:hypothetical protein
MFDRLKKDAAPRAAADPAPGWLERRRRTLPPARQVLADIPSGAVLEAPRRERQTA